MATLEKILATLNNGQPASSLDLTDDEKIFIRDLHLLTMKPVMLVANTNEGIPEIKNLSFRPERSEAEESPDQTSMRSLDSARDDKQINKDTPVVSLCAKLEAELADLPEAEARTMLADLGLPESGLAKLIRAGYQLLDLVTFLTSGEMETKAWTVTRGTKAPQAAGVIHTDFEKGFIRAEITDWKDFVAHGESGCKERGLTRTEGKEYVMRDGDVCYFKVAT